MKFRYIKDKTNWVIYFNIINHNLSTMGQMDIPVYLKRGYAKLLSFYPLTYKQEITFLNLTKKQKISFLFNYLIKILKQNNIKKSLILNLINIKNDYDYIIRNKPSKDEYNNKMLIYSLTKNYDNILDLYLYKNKIKNSYTKLIDFTILLIDMLIDDKYIKIKEYQKEYNRIQNQNQREGERARAIRVNSRKERKKNYFDLKIDLDDLNDKKTELERFIENEVNKRLKHINNLQVKSSDIPNDENVNIGYANGG
jgi:hypothetical protein